MVVACPLLGLTCGVQAALPAGLKQTKTPFNLETERCTRCARSSIEELDSRISRCKALCCDSKRSARFWTRSALCRSASARWRSNCTSMPCASWARSSLINASLASSLLLNSSRSSCNTAAVLSQTPDSTTTCAGASPKPGTSSRAVSSNSLISALVLSCARNSRKIFDTSWDFRNWRRTVGTVSDSSRARSCAWVRRRVFSSMSFRFVSRMHFMRNSRVCSSK
mmetsp:Transcript_125400/g.360273  ORF Transcript_125400/g.360273 Transcript_125400/m.360273 type:complete len:224 (+) Transcript_125400:1007-1678(+)